MGSTLDFLGATIADALSPRFRRPVEDIIYETIDRKQIPTRTDFTELRNIVNTLRSQTTGSTRGITKLKEGLDEIEESIHDLQTEMVDLKATVTKLMDENRTLQSQFQNNSSTDSVASTEIQALLNRIEALESNRSTESTTSVVPSEEVSQCKVDGCDDKTRGKGFCSRHYAKWRRGTLKGFVSYDATVKVNKQSMSVDEALIGQPFAVEGDNINIGDAVYTVPN